MMRMQRREKNVHQEKREEEGNPVSFSLDSFLFLLTGERKRTPEFWNSSSNNSSCPSSSRLLYFLFTFSLPFSDQNPLTHALNPVDIEWRDKGMLQWEKLKMSQSFVEQSTTRNGGTHKQNSLFDYRFPHFIFTRTWYRSSWRELMSDSTTSDL